VVCGWEPGDEPLEEHQRHFPRCPFLMEYNVGNIPLDKDPIRGPTRKPSRDVCGNHHNIHPGQDSSLFNERKPSQSPSSNLELKRYGVHSHTGPKHTEFVSMDSRIRSFTTDWPTECPVKPKELAEAGFFYIGMSDYVKCFYCDGGLCSWSPGDEPWSEHCRWFPSCHYVRLNKGDAFIESCQPKTENGNGNEAEANGIHPTDEQTLALEVVDKWLTSDIVQHLDDLYSFSKNVIKSVLYQRWVEKQRPFESFEDLYEAVSRVHGNLPNGSGEMSSGTASSESEDEAYRSSQESEVSSVSSTCSNSSSPPESLGYMSSGSQSSQSSQSSEPEENRLLCKVCLDREIGVVFLPCGHFVTCTQCAPGMSDCPICRTVIRGSVRTFLP
jgi:hypothetical protein